MPSQLRYLMYLNFHINDIVFLLFIFVLRMLFFPMGSCDFVKLFLLFHCCTFIMRFWNEVSGICILKTYTCCETVFFSLSSEFHWLPFLCIGCSLGIRPYKAFGEGYSLLGVSSSQAKRVSLLVCLSL